MDTDSVGTNAPGDGGDGASFSITGSAVTMAGGGGGGITSRIHDWQWKWRIWRWRWTALQVPVLLELPVLQTADQVGVVPHILASAATGGSGVVIVKVLATNASSVDTSGWIEVTAAMLAAAEKKRKAERKKLEKKMALEAKNAELSGQTNKTDIKENK